VTSRRFLRATLAFAAVAAPLNAQTPRDLAPGITTVREDGTVDRQTK
jgi:hypothetical protein